MSLPVADVSTLFQREKSQETHSDSRPGWYTQAYSDAMQQGVYSYMPGTLRHILTPCDRGSIAIYRYTHRHILTPCSRVVTSPSLTENLLISASCSMSMSHPPWDDSSKH